MSRFKQSALPGLRARFGIAALTAAIALTIASSAFAAIGVSGFSLTPSTTATGANPDLSIVATRSGLSSDDIRQAALKLPAGASYSVSAVGTKCSGAQFNSDACPSASKVGTAAVVFDAGSRGSVTAAGDVFATAPATAGSDLGIVYRPSGFSKQFVKATVSGSSTTGVTLTAGDFKKTINWLGLFPTDITIQRLDFQLKGKSGTTPIVKNPTACAPATSTVTLVPYSGTAASKTSSFTVTGCPVEQKPIVTITGGPAAGSLTSNTAASFTFTSVPSTVTFECRLDAAAYAACASGQSYSGLSDGSHTFYVRAKNGSTYSDEVSRQWSVDATAPSAPTVVRTYPTLDPTSLTTQNISVTPAEAGGSLACNLDGAAYAPCSEGTVTYSALTSGAHTFSARQTDAAGNTGSAASVTWTVGKPPPATPVISSGPASLTQSTTASFAFASVTAGVTYECHLDGASFTACVSPAAYTGLPDGLHTFYVRAVDVESQTSATSVRSWTIDTHPPTAPSLTLTSPAATPTNSTNATLTIGNVEAGATTQCSLNGGAFTACASPVSLTNLTDGTYTYVARAVDAAGNVGAPSSPVTWTVDTIPPAAPVVSTPPNGSGTTTSITFSGEIGATFRCRLDSAAYAPCTSPVALTGLTPTTHTFSVTATDPAGNTGSATTVAWNSFQPPPPGTYLETTASSWPSPSPQIGVASDFSGVTYQCQLNDSGTWTACDPNSGEYGGLTFNIAGTDATGANKVAIRATKFGVPDPTPAVTYVWVDDRAPHVDAAVTASTTAAAAHPDLSASISLDGGYNARGVTIAAPVGLNVAFTSTQQQCDVNDAYSGLCAANAPQSYIGSLTAEGLSTRDGYVTGVSGSLYLTAAPDPDTPAGIALDMLLPNGLGHIWAVGNIKINQLENGDINGETRVLFDFPSIPQRTSDLGNGFRIAKAALHLLADPDNDPATFPLLTNPTTCPAAPDQFDFTGSVYGDPNDDATYGPDLDPNHVYVDYPVAGCDDLEFAPALSQDFFMLNPIDGSTYDPADPGSSVVNVGSALDTNLPGRRKGVAGWSSTVSSGDSTATSRRAAVRRLKIQQPRGTGVNWAAVANYDDACPASSASDTTVFDASQCSPAAQVGTVSIDSPLFGAPLEGQVFVINKTPLPWLGIYITPNTGLTNPAGLVLMFAIPTGLECGPDLPQCTDDAFRRLTLTLDNMPDLPIDAMTLDLSGRTARPVDSTGTAPPGLLMTTPNVWSPADVVPAGCVPNDSVYATFGSSAGVESAGTLPTTMAHCFAPPPPTVTRVSPVGSSTTLSSATFNIAYSDPSSVILQCQVDSGPWSACSTGTTTVSVTGTGPHTFSVRAISLDGLDESRVSSSWSVVPISLTLTVNFTNPTSPTFPWTRNADSAPTNGFLCSKDGAAFSAAQCTPLPSLTARAGTLTWSGVSTGVTHTFGVKITDAEGHTIARTVTWTF